MSKVVCSALTRILLIAAASLQLILPSYSQQGNCTFARFNPPAGYDGGFYPNGIDDSSTVVGGAWPAASFAGRGFLRNAKGQVRLIRFPGSLWTELRAINSLGLSVGNYGSGQYNIPGDPNWVPGAVSNGFIVSPDLKKFAKLNYPGSPSTALMGVNGNDVIVGSALESVRGPAFGFKYDHGKFAKIKFPGAYQTSALAINDKGAIVGGYQRKPGITNPWAGYEYKNGIFTSRTHMLVGINDAGVIIDGMNRIEYPNGTIVGVDFPAAGSYVGGVNNRGTVTVTGGAEFGTFEFVGYIAVCKP